MLSTLAYFMADTGNEHEDRQRIREQIDVIGICSLPESTGDRNANFTTQIDGLITSVNNSNVLIHEGDTIEAYVPLRSELINGKGEADAKKGERPILWYRPYDRQARDQFNFANFRVAMQMIANLLRTYLLADVAPTKAPVTASLTALAQFWYRFLEAELIHRQRMVSRDYRLADKAAVVAAGLNAEADVAKPQRGNTAPGRDLRKALGGAAPVAARTVFEQTASIYALALDYLHPDFNHALFVDTIGAELMAYRSLTIDAERFVIGRALTSAAPGQEFDLIPRRQGK